MSSHYALGLEKLLKNASQIDLLADTIKVAAVKNSYVPNLLTDEFYSTISAHVVGTPMTLAGKTLTKILDAGKAKLVFDADNVLFSALPAGNTLSALVLYKDTGVAGSSPLIHLADAFDNLPYATTGADLSMEWDSGTNKIFAF